MKALIIFRDTDDTDNLFVPLLCKAIHEQGIDVHCSTREFWESDTADYDIIHFQWPEEVIGWNNNDPTVIEHLRERIDFFRSKGARFVYTRHNACAHYDNSIREKAYKLIEACSDTVVHMGQYSLEEFREKYPDTHSVLIPHHLYENAYREDITQEESRRRLHIPTDKFVVTAFGKFRKQEEMRMTLSAFYHWKASNKFLLAPRLFPFSRHPQNKGFLKRLASKIGYHLLIPLLNRLMHMHAGTSDEMVSNSDLPFYVAASDVIFIQRKRILNSGNVPLAFLFRRVVVGPDTGNVGEILRQTGNPVFDPDDTTSIVRALEQAKLLVQQGKGEANYRYAKRFSNLAVIARQYKQAYNETINADRDFNHQSHTP